MRAVDKSGSIATRARRSLAASRAAAPLPRIATALTTALFVFGARPLEARADDESSGASAPADDKRSKGNKSRAESSAKAASKAKGKRRAEEAARAKAEARERAKEKARQRAEAREKAKEKARQKARAKAWAACQPHKPQAFLQRSTFVRNGALDPQRHERALRFFAEHYGSVEVETTKRWSTDAARSHSKTVRFMGLPVVVHERVAQPLRCVERRIQATCKGKSSYTPRAVGGFRDGNTYRGGEVSNHLFGIAIDIDPERNPCCGCVDPWPTHALCKKEGASSIYDKTALPKCVVQAFERYGFYWLGRDSLQDTMHFEFLGDPP